MDIPNNKHPQGPNAEECEKGWNDIFQSPRRFEYKSNLHSYLVNKCPETFKPNKLDYTLFLVLITLKNIISSEKLFDINNPNIILCDESLDLALNVKALHVSELQEQICKQLHLVNYAKLKPEKPSPQLQEQAHPIIPSWASNTAPTIPTRIQPPKPFNTNGQYEVTPALLKALQTVEQVDPDQTTFYYKDVSNILSRYIIANKEKLFDLRNIRIALVQDDPLGQAFGVKAFSRTQVTSLLRSQLTPIRSTLGNYIDDSEHDEPESSHEEDSRRLEKKQATNINLDAEQNLPKLTH